MGGDARGPSRGDRDDYGSSRPGPRRDEWSGERSASGKSRGPVQRGGNTPPGKQGNSGAIRRTLGAASNSGSMRQPPTGDNSGSMRQPSRGGNSGSMRQPPSGGLIRPPLPRAADDADDRASGPRSGVNRASRRDASPPESGGNSGARRAAGYGDERDSGMRSSRANRSVSDRGENGPQSSGRSGAMRSPGDTGNRSIGERVRDAGRSMSRQLSAMVGGAGRAARQEVTSARQRLAGPPQAGGRPGPEAGVALPYRRSRARLLVRKWRMRRAPRNPIGVAIGIASAILVASVVVGAGGAGAVYAYGYYDQNKGNIQSVANERFNQSTRIYDRNGTLLYAVKATNGSFQFYVPLQQVNPWVLKATVDTEDPSFWQNTGIDFYGTLRAAYADATHGAAVEGGSTITQQLVKILVLRNSEKALDRKMHEMILAYGVTQQYTKAQILEMYLNNIEYGDQNQGIEAAARNYFGYDTLKNPDGTIKATANQQLTLAQVALLVRLPNAPTDLLPIRFSCDKAPCPMSQWDPANKLYGGHEQRDYDGAAIVLSHMVRAGDLSQSDADQTLQQVRDILEQEVIYHWKGLSTGTAVSEVQTKHAPHFVDYVLKQLINDFGMNDEKSIASAGLSVYTTLDWNLEKVAEVAADKYINHSFTRYWYCPTNGGELSQCDVPALKTSDNVHNAAAVALDPYSGDILMMVGSVDYASQDKQVLGFNNMAVRPRSMGSSTKPLVYATAFQMGWYPGIMLQDIPVCYPGKQDPPPNAPPDYKPPVDSYAPACAGYYVAHNYEDTSFAGPAPIHEMLANSLNIAATETMYFVGANANTADRFLSMVGRMGVTVCPDSPDAVHCEGLRASRMGPTTALGTQEIPLLELTNAYGVFAAGGKHVSPRAILRIDRADGTTLWQAPSPHPAQVLSPQAAYMITSILTDDKARAGAFKINNPLYLQGYPDYMKDIPDNYIAAKTGTSQGATGPLDIVTMGYSPYMALGVWAGNTNRDSLNQGIIGITGAGYIFHDVMKWALQNYKWPRTPFAIPPQMTRAQFNCDTGLAPYKGVDLTAFASDSPYTNGNGWCKLRPWPGSLGTTNVYVGYNAGPWYPNRDWIIDGQLPDLS